MQVDGRVPAGIVFAAAGNPHPPRPGFELRELGERVLEAGLVADDPGVTLHHGLERRLHGIWIFTLPFERVERLAHRLLDLGIGNRRRCGAFPRGVLAGPASEDQEVAQRVAAEAVGAVHAAGYFAGRVETGHRRLLRLGVHLDPAHHVMRRRADFHRVLGDIDVRQLFELVIHARQFFLDEIGTLLRGDVEDDAAVR